MRDRVTDAETDAVAEPDAVGDAELDGDADALADDEPVADPVLVAERVGEGEVSRRRAAPSAAPVTVSV